MNIRAGLFLILFAFAITASGQSEKRKVLTGEQQNSLLSSRLESGAIIGKFDSFTSLLFAVGDIAMHTEDGQINATELHSPFPQFYRPTVRELFDTIALQTRSSWKYDPDRDYWVFAKPANKKPFSLILADKWSSEDRGIYTGYKPPTFPVGMDIYYYGAYSADDAKKESELWEKIRNIWAVNFASKLKKGVSIGDMQKVSVDGVEALYFEGPAPRPGLMWRQWALVKNGHAFVIVSTLPAEDKQLFSDVQVMVKSFHLNN